MSETTSPTVIVAPETQHVVATAQVAQDLMNAAEQSPVVKADFESMFATYSHNPIVMGLVPIVGGLLTQQHVTVDSTLLTVAIGLAVTGAGYLYQWVAMKFKKQVGAPK